MAYWRNRGWKSLAALALEVGEPPSLLAEIEQGKRELTPRILVRIARALGMRIEDLVAD